MVRLNKAFLLNKDCMEAIIQGICEIMIVTDVRDAYHTLRQVIGLQKYCELALYYSPSLSY